MKKLTVLPGVLKKLKKVMFFQIFRRESGSVDKIPYQMVFKGIKPVSVYKRRFILLNPWGYSSRLRSLTQL
jgi:hypothetical protein